MRFKRIALFFILLANTLVLAHSIIPHHHHNGLVVDIATTKTSHNNDKNFNDHSHNNDDDTDCALRQEILVPGRIIRSGADQQNENTEVQFFQYINNAILISTDPSHNSCCSSLNHVQYDLSQYLFLLNNSQGLRAPPLS